MIVCTDDGQLFTFGIGENGRLGHGDTVNHTFPRRVEALAASIIKRVACGAAHTVVTTSTFPLHATCVHVPRFVDTSVHGGGE